MSCSTGCATPGEHSSYGECLRSKGARVAYCDSANRQDATRQKVWDKVNADYRDARRQGMEPDGCDRKSIDKAVLISNETGVAYRAGGV